jgi:hypothetical protein
MNFRSLSMAIAVTLLSAFAVAQTQTQNTAFQNTPYFNNYFSVNFNGTVQTDSSRSDNGQSTNYIYQSTNHGVTQVVVVRIVDHDIAVDNTSSDFYANDDRTGGTVDQTSKDRWQGHPFTYTFRHYQRDGNDLGKRTRFIIVNSRTVIFIYQIAAYSYDDRPEWLDFEYSLSIK